jgi:hypothetical protein
MLDRGDMEAARRLASDHPAILELLAPRTGPAH